MTNSTINLDQDITIAHQSASKVTTFKDQAGLNYELISAVNGSRQQVLVYKKASKQFMDRFKFGFSTNLVYQSGNEKEIMYLTLKPCVSATSNKFYKAGVEDRIKSGFYEIKIISSTEELFKALSKVKGVSHLCLCQ